MVISVDNGNKLTKTIHHTFTSGLVESETRPPFGNDILQYNGKYNSLSDKRIPYMREKFTDERFFILTLIGIAKEIECSVYRNINDVIEVELVTGLPPAHYGAQYERFEAYFLRENELTEFIFHERPYTIWIHKVISFPQAYAASMLVFNSIRSLPKATIVDVGGYTVDYIQLKRGQADLSVCDSLDYGIIILYNKIKSKINAAFNMLIDESDVDAVLSGENTGLPSNILGVIHKEAQQYIDGLLDNLRERMIDLRSGKAIFVGGGSMILKSYIENSTRVYQPIFINEINANAKGYEMLYKAYSSGRQWIE